MYPKTVYESLTHSNEAKGVQRVRLFSARWRPCTNTKPGYCEIRDLRNNIKIKTGAIGIENVASYLETIGVPIFADGFDEAKRVHYFMTLDHKVTLYLDSEIALACFHRQN